MVLASELLLPWLVPFLVNLVIDRLKRVEKFPLQIAVGTNSLLVLCLFIQHSTFPPLRLLKKLEVGNECPSAFHYPSHSSLPSRFYSMPQPRSPAPVFPANNCPWRCQYFNPGIAVSHYFLACLVLIFPPDFPRLLLGF